VVKGTECFRSGDLMQLILEGSKGGIHLWPWSAYTTREIPMLCAFA